MVFSFHALINGGSIFLIPALSPIHTSLRTGSGYWRSTALKFAGLHRCSAPNMLCSFYSREPLLELHLHWFPRHITLENNRGVNFCTEGKTVPGICTKIIHGKSPKKCSSLTRMILSKLSCNCFYTNIFPHCFTIKRRIIPLHFSDIDAFSKKRLHIVTFYLYQLLRFNNFHYQSVPVLVWIWFNWFLAFKGNWHSADRECRLGDQSVVQYRKGDSMDLKFDQTVFIYPDAELIVERKVARIACKKTEDVDRFWRCFQLVTAFSFLLRTTGSFYRIQNRTY